MGDDDDEVGSHHLCLVANELAGEYGQERTAVRSRHLTLCANELRGLAALLIPSPHSSLPSYLPLLSPPFAVQWFDVVLFAGWSVDQVFPPRHEGIHTECENLSLYPSSLLFFMSAVISAERVDVGPMSRCSPPHALWNGVYEVGGAERERDEGSEARER